MTATPLTITTDSRGVATVTLDRAEKHNAFDDSLIAALADAFRRLGADNDVRAMVLAANGKSFSAGADIEWMKRMASAAEAENVRDMRALAEMLRLLDVRPKPTMALVQGAALGGGVGLVACCDIAVASDNASFALSEVRLGLIPSTIGPYVVAAIGARAARRYFLTAERFGAAEARTLGLVHEVVPAADLAAAGERILSAVLACGPKAVAEAKALVRAVAGQPITEALIEDTARRMARIRAGDEAREGLGAFLAKRKPAWVRE
jgi:methylglutaconyl-CoA hydratase